MVEDKDAKFVRKAHKALEETEPILFRASFHNDKEPDKKADLVKQAQMMTWEGGATNVPRVPLLYMDPLMDPILFLYPRGESRESVKQINVRLRHYYETHRLVGNIIDLHSEFPLSDFTLRTKDPAITKYYNDFKDDMGLLQDMICWLKDYWLLGEAIVYGNWDPVNRKWSHFNQYPPESIEIRSTYSGGGAIYLLYPDDDPELKRICMSADPIDEAIRRQMPDEFVEAVKAGKPLVLDNSRVMHFARKPNKYARRGVSIVRRAIKDLMYEDKLRNLQLTFVDRHMFPIKVFKLGDKGLGWIPSAKHFTKFQALLGQAANDPDFNIIYHFGLEIDYVGTHDKIANLIPEFDFVEKAILLALFANDTVVHGDMATYAGQAISMRVLMNRYLTVRTQLEKEVCNKIFLPMAREMDFKDKEGRYILPEFMWEKTNLLSNTTQQDFVLSMRDKGDLPMAMVCDIFGWDKKIIQEQIKEEMGTVFDPVWREIYKSKSEDEFYQDQLFKGKKYDEWQSKEEEVEKEKLQTTTPPSEGKGIEKEKRVENEEPPFLGGKEIT